MFAFGYSYALFLQPVRLVKQIPLTLFLRGDALEKHRSTARSNGLICLEHFIEGLGISGTRLYGVSHVLAHKIVSRHRYLKPTTHGVLRNDIPRISDMAEKTKMIQLPLRLSCVGMLEPGKNQKWLIDMMKGLLSQRVQLDF